MATGWLGAAGRCHPAQIDAANDLQSSLPVTIVNEGSCTVIYQPVYNSEDGVVTGLIYLRRGLGACADTEPLTAVPIVSNAEQSCTYFGVQDANYAGWSIAAVWLLVYAVCYLRRAVK